MVRQTIDISTKKNILDDLDKGLSNEEIKTKYQLKNTSNIIRIKLNGEKIKASFESHDSPFKKSLKTTKLKEIDKGLKNFIANCNDSGAPVNTELVRQKALEIAREKGIENFKGSNGYITKFMLRNSVTFNTIHGEAGSVDQEIVKSWNIKLKDLIANVDPKDIYNGDELGLFWRLYPNKTYKLKDNVCRFGKQSKERFTVFVCSNMEGDKMPLVVIGKSEKPRNYREISKLNLFYYNNQKAWMNSEIFSDVVSNFNKKMVKEKRFILLFVDNCSAHPAHLNFSNVKVIFLPANTTSTLQPMDAGIIKCLKGYYRVKICRKIISMVENKEEVTPSSIKFFDALEILTSAWNYDLKPEVISNCFRHCGFFNAKCRDEPVEHEDVISREMAEMRNTFSSFYKESTLDDFIELDSNLLTNEPLELLVDNVSEIQDILEDDKDEKDDEMVQLKKVKRSEALNAVEILKLFAVQGDGSDELLNLLNRVEDKVYQRKLSLVQKRLSF